MLLVLAVILPVLAAGSQIAHVHVGDTPGFYNEQHVLDGAAAPSHAIPLPTSLAAIGAATTGAAVSLVSAPVVSTPAARHADPRAPPSA